MPIARFQMPDGRIGRFEVPEGTTPEQAQSLIQTHLDEQQAPAPEAAPTAAPAPEPTTWQRAKQYVMPVAEGLGMGLGAVAGAVPGTLVAPVAGTAGGAVLGAGLGYAGVKELERLGDQYFDGKPAQPLSQVAGNTAKNVAVGGAMEMGGQFIVPPAMRAAGWMWDQAGGRMIQIKAGRVLREISGDRLAQIRGALAQSAPGETAGQAVAGAGVNAPTFQAAEAMARRQMPEQFGDITLAQQQGRQATLRGVTPDLAAAEAARTAASRPLYQQADQAVVPMTPQMTALMDRLPRGVMEHAEQIARVEGRPFVLGANAQGQQQVSGESLHYIKRALSDIVNRPATQQGVSRDLQNSVSQLMPQFLREFEGAVPAYGQARAAFAQGSVPVNQSNILTDIQNVLRNPVSGGENPNALLRVMGNDRSAARMARRSTGQARFDTADDVLNALAPNQRAAVEGVNNQLARDAQMAPQAREGATRLNQIMGTASRETQLPNPLSSKITIINKVMSAMQGRVNERTLRAISEAMMNGRTTLELLDTVPASQRNAMLRALQETSGHGVAVNALAPQEQ